MLLQYYLAPHHNYLPSPIGQTPNWASLLGQLLHGNQHINGHVIIILNANSTAKYLCRFIQKHHRNASNGLTILVDKQTRHTTNLISTISLKSVLEVIICTECLYYSLNIKCSWFVGFQYEEATTSKCPKKRHHSESSSEGTPHKQQKSDTGDATETPVQQPLSSTQQQPSTASTSTRRSARFVVFGYSL